MIKKQLALVTGGTGKIGPVLVAELLSNAYRVRVLVRRMDALASVPFYGNPDIEFVRGDITDAASLKHALEGVNVVFHLAALLHINNPGPEMMGKYNDVNVNGTRNLLSAAMAENVSRLVLFSTISIYGSGTREQSFDETSPVNPKGMYAISKLGAEAIAHEFNKKTRDQPPLVTILRLASVYGKHMAGNYLLLVNALKKGFLCLPGGGASMRTLIHEKDVAAGAVIAARNPMAAGKTYNLTDGHAHTLKDIVESIKAALDKKAIVINLPEYPLVFMSDFIKKYHNSNTNKYKLVSEFLLKIDYMLGKLMEDVIADGSKIQHELGFKPAFNLRQGWLDALGKLY